MARPDLQTLRAAVARIARVRAVCASGRVRSRAAGVTGALLVLSGALGAQTYTLTIRSGTGTGAGGVTAPATAGQPAMNCAVANGVTSGTCSRTYGRATAVTLTATPVAGSVFSGWSGACAAAGSATTCTVSNLTGAQSAIASFARSCPVSVTAGTGGAAAVTAGGATGPCGRSITVSASPNAAFTFQSWSASGATVSTANPYTFTITSPQALTANFAAVPQCALVLTAVPADGGTVALSSGTASGECGRSVTAVATPARNFTFTGWSEAAASATYTLTVTQTTQPLSAQFASLTAVRVVISGAQGRVLRGAAGAEVCALADAITEATCTIAAGAEQIVAAPTATSGFVGWRGACSGRGSCGLASIGGQEVKALFVPVRAINGDEAARDLLTGQGLTASDRDLLDQTGNGDGAYNLGDLLAHLERTRQSLSPQLSAQVLSSAVPLQQPIRTRAARTRRP